MKICIHCHQEKPLGEYYKHPGMADGRLGACKVCCRERARKNNQRPEVRQRDRERRRGGRDKKHVSRMRQWRKDHPGKAVEYNRKYRKKYQHKTRAGGAVRRAIQRGEIVRPDWCSCCGLIGPVEAHHDDYEKPLDIRFLCSSCHGQTKWIEDKQAA